MYLTIGFGGRGGVHGGVRSVAASSGGVSGGGGVLESVCFPSLTAQP
jgi:hypothetical protein